MEATQLQTAHLNVASTIDKLSSTTIELEARGGSQVLTFHAAAGLRPRNLPAPVGKTLPSSHPKATLHPPDTYLIYPFYLARKLPCTNPQPTLYIIYQP